MAITSALYFSDNFVRADSATVGNGWTQPATAWSITSNKLHGGFVGSPSTIVQRPSVLDSKAEWLLSGTAVGNPHGLTIVTRVQGNGDCYIANFYSNASPVTANGITTRAITCEIRKLISSTNTLLTSSQITINTANQQYYCFAAYSFGEGFTKLALSIRDAVSLVETPIYWGDSAATLQVNGGIGIYRSGAIDVSLFNLYQYTRNIVAPKTYRVDNYYGSDTNVGSSDKPWRTIEYALARIAPDEGHTLVVEKTSINYITTYTNSSPGAIPSGITMIGRGSPIVVGTFTLTNASQNTISGINFKSVGYSLNLALTVKNCYGLFIQNCSFSGYLVNAIDIQRITNGNFCNSQIDDCSYNQNVGGLVSGLVQSTALNFGFLKDFLFAGNSINTAYKASNNRVAGRGGQGMKAVSDFWASGNNSGSNLLYPTTAENVTITNNRIFVDGYQAWGSGSTPQLCLETWNCNCINLDVSNNYFNAALSMVASTAGNSTSILIHDNYFEEAFDASYYYYYAIECSDNNMEIYNNFVVNAYYPFSYFGSGNTGKQNLNIHNNVIITATPASGGVQLLATFGTLYPIKFNNNTCFIRSSNNCFAFSSTENASNEIKNNIFYSVTPRNNTLNATIGFTNNDFYNITPVGSSTIATDPLFLNAGDITKLANFRLLANSPVIGAGVSGVDLGALPYANNANLPLTGTLFTNSPYLSKAITLGASQFVGS